MSTVLLPQVTITGLPRDMHEGEVVDLTAINYFFGANGSGKTLSLKHIANQAKKAIRTQKLDGEGIFAQYITATPPLNFYQDQFQILDKKASEFDLENPEITGQAFYQHLQEYPEISIKVRDALQKYLGRYPNVVRRGIHNVMKFFREEEDVPEYSPQQESDGLRRLSLLLTYIYHPKCKFLAIDEPELFLHPDMISFLLEEIHEEINYGKQYIFATHSPEIIRIGSGDIYSYVYFNLKDTLAETHIIQASKVGANSIIEKLGRFLDVNRRAFLFAPITLFVEGLDDELVYSELKRLDKVKWHRRIFMVNTGGAGMLFDFWNLWNKFDKQTRVILDHPSSSNDSDTVMQTINQFCNVFKVDVNLDLEKKIVALEKHRIIVAPYKDVLTFVGKNIKARNFIGALPSLDVSAHVATLEKALSMEEPKRKQIRKDEREWLKAMIQQVIGDIAEVKDKTNALQKAEKRLKQEHPTLRVEPSNEGGILMEIHFDVSKDRTIYAKISEKTLESSLGVK